MTDTADRADVLLALAKRCEAARGGDEFLDLDISRAARPKWGGEPFSYSASLDAAMLLIGEMSFWQVGHDQEDPAYFLARVYDPLRMMSAARAMADTPALALCAAALRALAT